MAAAKKMIKKKKVARPRGAEPLAFWFVAIPSNPASFGVSGCFRPSLAEAYSLAKCVSNISIDNTGLVRQLRSKLLRSGLQPRRGSGSM
jgi:hypothetical protein